MNKKLTILTVVVMLLTFTSLGTGQSQAVEPVKCGDTIEMNTTLDSDLTCSGPALIIGNPGITLDLNGHTLTGNGTGTGVSNDSYDNVTIKNGVIDGFENGIEIDGADGNTLTDLEVRNSGEVGIELDGADGNTLTDLEVRNSGEGGIELDDADGNTLTDLEVHNSGEIGIELEENADGNTLTDLKVHNSGEGGIVIAENANDNTLTDLEVRNSGEVGIVIWRGEGNTLTDLEVRNSGYAGIAFVEASECHIGECLIVGAGKKETDGYGIYLSESEGNSIVENVIMKNYRGICSDQGSANNDFIENILKNNTVDIYDYDYDQNTYTENKFKTCEPPDLCE